MPDRSRTSPGDKPAVPSMPVKPKVLDTPAAAVVIRKIRGPDGTHVRIGQVFVGGLSTVEPKLAAELTDGVGAEFEAMNANEAAKIARYRETHPVKDGAAKQ